MSRSLPDTAANNSEDQISAHSLPGEAQGSASHTVDGFISSPPPHPPPSSFILLIYLFILLEGKEAKGV